MTTKPTSTPHTPEPLEVKFTPEMDRLLTNLAQPTPHTVPLEWTREETIREWMKSEYFPNESVQVPIDEGGTEGYFISEIIARYVARHSPQWVKIEEGKPETLPPDHEEVLVWFDRGKEAEVLFGRYLQSLDELRISGSNSKWNHAITHWMPLPPAPPSEGETRK